VVIYALSVYLPEHSKSCDRNNLTTDLHNMCRTLTAEKFEDTKEVISQCNGEKKNRQKGQAIIYKTLHRKIMLE
jgi:hypothetical protein